MAKYNLMQTGALGEIKDTKIPDTILRAITWHTISIELNQDNVTICWAAYVQ